MFPLAALVSSVTLLLGGGGPARVQAAPAPVPAPVIALSLRGHGWGHGVGMSQWGAYGFAQHGSTYGQILTHYFRGTELGKADATPERVLLLQGATKVDIASAAPFAVKEATGESHDLPAGAQSFGNGLRLKVGPDGSAKQLTGPLVFTAGSAPLSLNGRRYRGSLEVAVANERLRVVNTVGLDAYVLGVVPSEVPSSWPAEALKAQAVAARSYALATRKPAGPFDAYADVRSQVYGGLDVERPATNAAVQATAGQVVLYQGKVATTYFFSTSGGKTADIADAWPGSEPVPYLVSVPDPYDTASPYHSWGPLPLTPRKLKQALGLSRVPVDVRLQAGRSGRVVAAAFTLAGGGEASVPGTTIRSAFGLRSTWFTFDLLALRPPGAVPVTFGTKAPLTGFLRGLSSASLERRPIGGGWKKVGTAAAARDGTFTVPVRGKVTADYRLAADKLAGPAVRLVVAPRLKLKLGDAPGAVAGTVRPVFARATVVLQRLDGARWVRVGTALVNDSGAFQADVALPPGTYRARLAPRAGYAAGVSQPLVVTS
jgi:stage II sporulation protein D